MSEFTIEVAHAEEHAKKLNQLALELDSRTTQVIADELEAIGVWLEGEVKRRTPTDTGSLRASIFSELRVSGQSLEELISAPLVHSAPVEFGRKPGKMPPSAALKGWARRKLGDEKLAFVVARAIGRKGTKPNEMFQKAFEENAGAIARKLENIGVHVSEELLRSL